MTTYVRPGGWVPGIFDLESEPLNLTSPPFVIVSPISTTGLVSDPDWAQVDRSEFIGYINDALTKPVGPALQLEEQFKAAFGYAQKVSELCHRLEKAEGALLDVVNRLESSAKQQRPLWVPIESFAPEPYEILRPITAVVTPVEDGFEAGLFDAKLFSTGDTEVEALDNLKSMIIETYSAFEQLGDSKLGPGPLRQQKVLATLIRRAES